MVSTEHFESSLDARIVAWTENGHSLKPRASVLLQLGRWVMQEVAACSFVAMNLGLKFCFVSVEYRASPCQFFIAVQI